METRSKGQKRRGTMEEESDTDMELGVQALMEHGYATDRLDDYENLVNTRGESDLPPTVSPPHTMVTLSVRHPRNQLTMTSANWAFLPGQPLLPLEVGEGRIDYICIYIYIYIYICMSLCV